MTGAPARRRGLIGAGLAALTAFALLCGLGVWQLERLKWKEALIARIEARVTAAPAPLPAETQWQTLAPDDYDYRRVSVTGVFDSQREALVFRSLEVSKADDGGPGYLVLTPLRLASGASLIVNRGFIPQTMRERAARPAAVPVGEVALTGLMRPPEARNLFTPADDPGKGAWFTRDPAAIAAALGLARAAPFTLDADAAPGQGFPRAGVTVLAIPNSHLSYALTWFGLAAALAAVFAMAALRRLRA